MNKMDFLLYAVALSQCILYAYVISVCLFGLTLYLSDMHPYKIISNPFFFISNVSVKKGCYIWASYLISFGIVFVDILKHFYFGVNSILIFCL